MGTTPLRYQTAAPGAPMIPDAGELAVVRHILRLRACPSFRRIAAELATVGTGRSGAAGSQPRAPQLA